MIQVSLEEGCKTMRPLRDFLSHMARNYPYEEGTESTCKSDFASLHVLVAGSQNPSSVLRIVAEVRAAAKEKQSPRALLATFGALPQGRRLLEINESQAQGTIDSLKFIGKLDEVANKAKSLSLVVRGAISDVKGLDKMIDASLSLVDSFVAAQKAVVNAAQDLVVDTQENQSYTTTVNEAQEHLAALIRGCARKHISLEGEQWLKSQIEALQVGGALTAVPNFKITCFSNVNLKKLGCPLQEIPDLLSFYKASSELQGFMETLVGVMSVSGSDHAEKQSLAATQTFAAVKLWIQTEKAVTVSFRELHQWTCQVKELLTASVTKHCISAWSQVMKKPLLLLSNIMSVGWGKTSLNLETSDVTSAISACADAGLLSTGFECAGEPRPDGAGHVPAATEMDGNVDMVSAAEFVKRVLEAACKLCDANSSTNDAEAFILKAHATKCTRAALCKVKFLVSESNDLDAAPPSGETLAQHGYHIFCISISKHYDIESYESYDIILIPYRTKSCDIILIPYRIISHHIKSYHIIFIQNHTIPHHIISYHIISYHIISYHIISYHLISSHHITSSSSSSSSPSSSPPSYHIIDHIISYHTSYHIISYHIISYHIIHHIISYHIISYHIISGHIISYHISSYHITSHLITITIITIITIISYHIIHHIISYHTSYHVISYHIMSCHTMSYHITSYHTFIIIIIIIITTIIIITIISYHTIHHMISSHLIASHISTSHHISSSSP